MLPAGQIQRAGFDIEQFEVTPHPRHRWGIFDGMTHDELLCFTQGKCSMHRATTVGSGSAWEFELPEANAEDAGATDRPHGSSHVLHMAVRDPRAAEGKHRASCETRYVVFVPVDAEARSRL